MRETEKNLTSVVRFEFSLSDLVLFRLKLKSIQSFLWLNTCNHRTILLEVLSEMDNICNKRFDSVDQIFLESRLLILKIISDGYSLLNKFIPILVDDCGWIFVSFLVDILVIKEIFKKIVHFDDRSELDLDG